MWKMCLFINNYAILTGFASYFWKSFKKFWGSALEPLTIFWIFYSISFKPRNYPKRNEKVLIILQHFHKNLNFSLEKLCRFFKIFLLSGLPPPEPLQERCTRRATRFSSELFLATSLNDNFKGFCRLFLNIFDKFRGLRSRSSKYVSNFQIYIWFW